MLADYLFTIPESGAYQPWLIVLAAVAVLVWIASTPIGRRSGFAAVRRRARRLGRIMAVLGLTIGISLAARLGDLPVVSWRIWLIIGLFGIGIAFGWWLLGLRDLTHDKVEERHRQREQFYRTPRNVARKRRNSRRRRRN